MENLSGDKVTLYKNMNVLGNQSVFWSFTPYSGGSANHGETLGKAEFVIPAGYHLAKTPDGETVFIENNSGITVNLHTSRDDEPVLSGGRNRFQVIRLFRVEH